jgi:Fungal Zn(2)-Cys(6) binuclear cluster domain
MSDSLSWAPTGSASPSKPPPRPGESFACLRCRRLKMRCEVDPGQPVCRRCAKGGHQCEFREGQKRGKKPAIRHQPEPSASTQPSSHPAHFAYPESPAYQHDMQQSAFYTPASPVHNRAFVSIPPPQSALHPLGVFQQPMSYDFVNAPAFAPPFTRDAHPSPILPAVSPHDSDGLDASLLASYFRPPLSEPRIDPISEGILTPQEVDALFGQSAYFVYMPCSLRYIAAHVSLPTATGALSNTHYPSFVPHSYVLSIIAAGPVVLKANCVAYASSNTVAVPFSPHHHLSLRPPLALIQTFRFCHLFARNDEWGG